MKSPLRRSLLSGAIFAAVALPAHAGLVFLETFEGANWVGGSSAVGVSSNSAGAAGQSGAWGVHAGSGVTVTTGNTSGLSYANGTVEVAGGAKYLSFASSAAGQSLQFGVGIADIGLRSTNPFNGVNPGGLGAGGSLYFSALVRVDAGTLAGDRFEFGFANAALGGGGVFTGVGFGGNTDLTGQVTANGVTTTQATGSAAVLGQSYFLVGRLSSSDGINFTSMDLWLNPNSATTAGTPLRSVSGLSFSNSQVTFVVSATSLDAGDSLSFDSIRAGTTWSSVVPTAVPEPSAFAALAGLGALGFSATRRRRG